MSRIISCVRCGKEELIESESIYAYRISNKFYCSYTCWRAEGGDTGVNKKKVVRESKCINIGSELKSYIASYGLSPDEFAKKVGVSKFTINKWYHVGEVNVRNITKKKLLETEEGRGLLKIIADKKEKNIKKGCNV